MKRSHITAALVLALLAIVAMNFTDLLRGRSGESGDTRESGKPAVGKTTGAGGGGERPGGAGPGSAGAGSGAPMQSGDIPSGRGLPVARPRINEIPVNDPQRQAAEDAPPQDPVVKLVDSYWEATSAEAQFAVLRELGQFPQPRILAVLRPSLEAEEAGTRAGALVLMREMGVSDPDILAGVRSAAYSDSSPQVRLAALEVLVRYDEGPETRALLEGLAADPASAHRDFAIRELKRMDYEAAARSRPDPQLMQLEKKR